MIRKILYLSILASIFISSSVFAATILLKDGSRQYGFLIEERADIVIIRRGGKDIEIPLSEIEAIETAPSSEKVELYQQIMSFYNTNPDQVADVKPYRQEYVAPKHEELYEMVDVDDPYAGIDGGMYQGLTAIEDAANEAEAQLKQLQNQFDQSKTAAPFDKLIPDNQDVVADLHQQNNMLDVLESVGYEVDELRDSINGYTNSMDDPFNN